MSPADQTRAEEFLRTSSDYFEGKIDGVQTSDALREQVNKSLQDGSWRDALMRMNAVGTKDVYAETRMPNVSCSDELALCRIRPSSTHWDADKSKSIEVNSHNDNSVQINIMNKQLRVGMVEVPALKDLDDVSTPFSSSNYWSNDAPNDVKIVDSRDGLLRLSMRNSAENASIRKMLVGSHRSVIDVIPLNKFSAFPNLKELSININAADEDLKFLAENQNLEYIGFSMNVHGVTGDGLKYLSQLPKLRKLDLGYLKLETLENLTSSSLAVLRVGPHTKGSHISSIAKLKNLRTLEIAGSDCTVDDLKMLAESKSLRNLVLNQPRKISREDLERLRAMMPYIRVTFG